MIRIFEELNALVLGRDELEKFGIVEEIFLNVNDIEATQFGYYNRREVLVIRDKRKAEHLALAVNTAEGPCSNGFEDVYLVHDSCTGSGFSKH